MSAEPRQAVTWGVVGEHAVFGWRSQITELREIREAIKTANTWGEFRERIARDRAEELREQMEDDDPPDAAEFDAADLPGYSEGDWPEWLQQDMLSWIPEDVQRRYGSVEASRISGDALVIYADAGDDVATALESHGYTCTRDDRAVLEAAGWA